jgi:hypothetical protein
VSVEVGIDVELLKSEIKKFGVRGRQLLSRPRLPEPWQGTIEASLRLTANPDRPSSPREEAIER